jgi:hypothetical protein
MRASYHRCPNWAQQAWWTRQKIVNLSRKWTLLNLSTTMADTSEINLALLFGDKYDVRGNGLPSPSSLVWCLTEMLWELGYIGSHASGSNLPQHLPLLTALLEAVLSR